MFIKSFLVQAPCFFQSVSQSAYIYTFDPALPGLIIFISNDESTTEKLSKCYYRVLEEKWRRDSLHKNIQHNYT